jgi:hypothetical protein
LHTTDVYLTAYLRYRFRMLSRTVFLIGTIYPKTDSRSSHNTDQAGRRPSEQAILPKFPIYLIAPMSDQFSPIHGAIVADETAITDRQRHNTIGNAVQQEDNKNQLRRRCAMGETATLNRRQRWLAGLLLFLGFGGTGAGLAVLTDKSTYKLSVPLDTLQYSANQVYFWPGLLIIVCLGLLPLLIALNLYRHKIWAERAATSLGVLLVGSIIGLAYWFREFTVLHGVFLVLGLAIILLSLPIRLHYHGIRQVHS